MEEEQETYQLPKAPPPAAKPRLEEEARVAEEKKEAGQTRKRDISTLDREWIMGFTAGSSVEAEGDVSGASAAEEEAAASADEAPLDEAWFPSPERVVWEWPRMDERVVEDPD